MKFAHFADCHIGGWKEDKLRQLGIDTFERAVDYCIKENTAFVLISGDLFNTALPSIELIKEVARILRKLRDNDIEIYIIAGSHDFSPSGKTMLDVLEKADLVRNVNKYEDGKLVFTEDKTGVKITGILGLKGGLETENYKNLNKYELETESGYKIFMFHTALNEFKPRDLENVDCMDAASLPNNFNYYAGGHVHYIFEKDFGKGKLVYPGALFPNNFKELEEYKHGGFYLIDDKNGINYIPIKLKEVLTFVFSGDNKEPKILEQEIMDRLNKENVDDKIIMMRVECILKNGKPSDVDFKKIYSLIENKAYFVMKNTNKLTTKELEELNVEAGNVNEIEEKIIESFKMEFSKEQILNFIEVLSLEKMEGEKNFDFESKIIKNFSEVLKLDIE